MTDTAALKRIRNSEILRRHLEGETYVSLEAAFGITRVRCRAIAHRELYRIRQQLLRATGGLR